MTIKPTIIDLALDFSKRRLPILSLWESAGNVPALLGASSETCDCGLRKEAVFFDLTNGEIACFERGTVHLRFRSTEASCIIDYAMRILDWICGKCDWDVSREALTIDVDVIIEIPAQRPQEKLDTLCSPDNVAEFLGLNREAFAIGYRLFLTKLDDQEDDLKVRVEPSATYPDEKFYLHIRDFRRSRTGKDVNSCLDRALQVATTIHNKLGKGQ